MLPSSPQTYKLKLLYSSGEYNNLEKIFIYKEEEWEFYRFNPNSKIGVYSIFDNEKWSLIELIKHPDITLD